MGKLIIKWWQPHVLLILLLAGCASLPQPARSLHSGEPGPAGACADFFAALDQTIESAGLRDAGEFRVSGYPYLRVDRFLAAFRHEVRNPAPFEAWLDRLQTLDRRARQYEIANLPRNMLKSLQAQSGTSAIDQRLHECGDILRAADFQASDQKRRLHRVVQTPDDYLVLRRVFGLSPLTGAFIADGVNRWHQEARKAFTNSPPQQWQTTRYVPAPSDNRLLDLHAGLQSLPRDALGLPLFTAQSLAALFSRFAPIWEVQTAGAYDHVGAPFWRPDSRLGLDTARPITYNHLSFTRFKSDLLPQLNYIVWFPARPKNSPFDILGGFLDGINYRVTLDTDGQPLLYDTIHNCGCYHKFYPTARLTARLVTGYAEPPLVLKAPALDPTSQHMVIALESRTHYAQHLYTVARSSAAAGKPYQTAEYGRLRTLPLPKGGSRSMFGEDGLVARSQRQERWILWPTGVLAPGSMRQWGRHAVAFVGRRHFDDPDLLERIFIRSGREGGGG